MEDKVCVDLVENTWKKPEEIERLNEFEDAVLVTPETMLKKWRELVEEASNQRVIYGRYDKSDIQRCPKCKERHPVVFSVEGYFVCLGCHHIIGERDE